MTDSPQNGPSVPTSGECIGAAVAHLIGLIGFLGYGLNLLLGGPERWWIVPLGNVFGAILFSAFVRPWGDPNDDDPRGSTKTIARGVGALVLVVSGVLIVTESNGWTTIAGGGSASFRYFVVLFVGALTMQFIGPGRRPAFLDFHVQQSVLFQLPVATGGLFLIGIIGVADYVKLTPIVGLLVCPLIFLGLVAIAQTLRMTVAAGQGALVKNVGASFVPASLWIFVARRLLAILPLLVIVSFLTYTLQRASPGDYYTALEENPTVSKEHIEQQRAKAGLDKGIILGYLTWLDRATQGDFGTSFTKEKEVFGLIAERMANTLLLSCCALFVAWIVAIPLGVVAAMKPNSLLDKGSGVVAYFGLSIPSVFFALLMMMFASATGWFPLGSMRDLVRWDDFSVWEKITDVAHHLVLPVFVLSTIAMATWMRQMRSSMIETLGQDYIRTARAKGVSRPKVLFKHALRNAINPIVTLFGYSIAYILNGSFLVEVVMSWPGLARLVVQALFAKDQPLVMAAVLMAACMLVLGNMVADILLAMTDPRIRLS